MARRRCLRTAVEEMDTTMNTDMRGGGRRVVVTGGAGFIGSHLVDRLVALGYFVTVLDDLSTGRMENISHLAEHLLCRFVPGSILDRMLLKEMFKDATYVFHQAAIPSVPRSIISPEATHEVNATGTLYVLIAARDAGVKKLVFASSSSVYGDSPTLPKTEDMPPNPLSPYAVAKLAAEAYCGVFSTVYGLPTVALRYFNVFGPRQDPNSEYAAVIPKFIRAALRGEPLTVYGSGNQTRDFTYVEDVVNANVRAATGEATGVLNIACGTRITITELARVICELTGSSSAIAHLPTRPGDIEHSLADTTRAAGFGWTSETSLSQGIESTIRAFS